MDMDRIFQSLDRIEQKIDNQNTKINDNKTQLAVIEQKVSSNSGFIKAVISVAIAAVTGLVTWFFGPLINK